VPNSLAGGLASRQTRLVAAIVPSVGHSLFSDMVNALITTLAAQRYETTLGISNYDPEHEETWLAAMLSRRPDGVVLTGIEHTARTRRLLLNADILRSDDSRAHRRAQGFLRAAAEANAPEPPQIIFSESSPQAGRGREALRALLAQAPNADAAFCSSDALACGVLAHAHALGIKVPQQLGVLGFGDQALAIDTIPALSTIRVNGAHIGHAGAQALIARMQGTTVTPAQDLGFDVTARDSTAFAPT
jgi:LacI family gluconate utilization system Gnt-I transcriptional repressor